MRTTVDLPEDLLEEARKLSQTKTIRETLVAALEELIRRGRREELRRMAGGFELGTDVVKARGRRAK